MGWRNVIITKPARLFLSDGHLVVEQKEQAHIPLEDISVVIVETQQAVITLALINKLAEDDIPLFVCDSQHLPSAVSLPFQQHSRFLKVLKSQFNQTEAFKKNCWRLIVQQKIINQAKCLEFLGKSGSTDLFALSKAVKSGDNTNREGVAAQTYFASYMPYTNRKKEDSINSALNYGYAIIRGAVARSLTAYGLLCAYGVHHRNELNSFNLADDFMEPLRPIIDLWAAKNIKDDEEFTTEHKVALVSLLNAQILLESEKQTINRAIEIMCASYISAIKAAEPKLLKLPELLGFE